MAEFPDPAQVVANRAGDVLIKQTLLKADHFPGCVTRAIIAARQAARLGMCW
jgi:hypothetical protein